MTVTPPFQTLLDRHAGDIYRFLVATVGRVDADDCWQETWLAALRAYPRLRGSSNLRSWLFTIAHRKAIDWHRSRNRRPVPVADVHETGAVGPTKESDPELWELVGKLPPKQRTAVVLRFVNDLPYREVGRVMGSSAEAARRNVHEGLKKLREVWEQ
jgi:RNA polymerase sigma factor (sigma-70 family)